MSDVVVRAPLLVLVVLVAGLGGGCGGHTHATASAPPRLPRAVARQLAAASDQVARELTAGDGCAARATARQLQQLTIRAINERRVPAAFQETLQSAVNDLSGRIRCVPPSSQPVPAPAPPPKDHGKHKDHGRHKGHEGDQGD